MTPFDGLYSIIIPARNEEQLVGRTIYSIHTRLKQEGIDHEFILLNDGSTDTTATVIENTKKDCNCPIHLINRVAPHGFGRAIREGLETFNGEACVIVMADGSDSHEDIVSYYRVLQQGYDCAFGSRFMKGSSVTNYPLFKLILNRIANRVVQLLFWTRLNDTTNAFKAYRRHVIQKVSPILSVRFNITVELPLKAIIRGATYKVLPISWVGEEETTSHFKIREAGSRYFFIIIYVLMEHLLIKRDIAMIRDKGKRLD